MNNYNDNGATDHQALIEINKKICEAEFQRDTQYLKTIMSDDLIFRRTNGDLVGKEQFLEQLEKREVKYDELVAQGIEFTVDKDTTVVTLFLWAKGQRKRD